jgi:eukaryotic-like serine/threonine-protein kinase
MDILGEVISGQFRVDELIAAGSMGPVFRVWDFQQGADHVMKVVYPDLANNPALMGQLMDENLKSLTHPNIVPYYGFYNQQEPAFSLRGFVNGQTLTEFLGSLQTGKSGLPLKTTLAVLKSLCAALDYAHNNGVLHCNIKQNNVFIDQDGQVKLVDFGVTHGKKSRFADKGLFRTVAYWAPEQIMGEELTRATDVYAVGVLLFQMTTGQYPFRILDMDHNSDRLSRQMMMDAHMNQIPPGPDHLSPEVSPDMAQVILRALDKAPENRYSETGDLFEAFYLACGVTPDQVSDTLQVEALPENDSQPDVTPVISEKTIKNDPSTETNLDNSDEDLDHTIIAPGSDVPFSSEDATNIITPPEEESPSNRKRFLLPLLLLGGVGLLCLLLVVGGGLGYYFLGGGQNTAATAVDNLMGQNSPLSAGETTTATSPIGVEPELGVEILLTETLPPPDTRAPATATQTATATLTATATITLTSTPAPVGGGSGLLAFAAFVNEIPQVFVMGLDGSDRQQLTDLNDGACQPDWSPNGEQIVFISPCSRAEHYKAYAGANLYLMNADGSGQEKLPIQAGDGDFDPAWSPDGSQIAFTAVGRVNADVLPHLYIYRMADHSITDLLSNTPARSPSWSPDGQQLVFEMTRGQIWIVNADGTGKTVMFSTPELISYAPSWSPDGELILFGQQRTPLLVGKTISNRFQGSDPVDSVITLRPAWEPEFSQDGQWVLISHDDKTIHMFKVGGSEFDVEELGVGFHPTWGP